MHSESDKILKIFDESGADVSFKDRRIRIPEHRSINVAKRKVEEILREHQPEPLSIDRVNSAAVS